MARSASSLRFVLRLLLVLTTLAVVCGSWENHYCPKSYTSTVRYWVRVCSRSWWGRCAYRWQSRYRIQTRSNNKNCCENWGGAYCHIAVCGRPDAQYPIASKPLNNANLGGLGVEAAAHSLPWQILIEQNDDFKCGGSLISPDWVITAAQCVAESGYSIVAGAHDRSADESTRQVRPVSEVFIHEDYDNNDNNIALLKLETPLEFNEFVKPVCVGKMSVLEGTECLTSGYGVTGSGSVSSKLMQQYITVVSQDQCQENLGGSSMTDNMLCAGDPQDATGTCSSDPGGPFVCQTTSGGAWVLYGVTSRGYGCDQSGSPGVWARVSNYRDWIQELTGWEVSFVN